MTNTDTDSAATEPLFSTLDLDERILRNVESMGFQHPTEIQRRVATAALEGRDVVGLSQTGSGKTLAFLLPALTRMLREGERPHAPRLLVLTPTRELALQVSEEARRLTVDTGLTVTTVFGGRGMQEQTAELKFGTDVIVATPGRLLDHINRRNVRLDAVEALVLDEADRMLDMGFIDDIRRILSYVPRDRQTLLFGATMPAQIELLSADFQRSPEVIEVARQKPPESIEQVLFPVGPHLKSSLLVHLLREDPAMLSVLVFTDTKRESDTVARQLREMGIATAFMHGDRSQQDREKALQRLQDGTARVLVATNVAARGLDIDDISHVVNYDMPRSVDEYVHRIGRTARAAAQGSAFSFVGHDDEAMVARVESALERELPRRMATGFDYDVPTPSWAQPSSKSVQEALIKVKSPADVSRRVRFRR